MERCGTGLTVVSLLVLSACSKASAPRQASHEAVALSAPTAPQGGSGASMTAPTAAAGDLERAARKTVRGADLGIAARDVAEAEQRAAAVMEELGGYVASSDRSVPAADDELGEPAVNMVLRVPSDRFTVAIGRLEELGSRVLEKRVHSDDVTEEFIDLKARLVAQRALETQFLEILRQARSVKDALEVNVQLADVRTNIEKLEGRQRFLENQTSISTIKLGITHGAPLVRAGRFAFGDSIERAGADLLNVSAAIVHGGIRLMGVMTPIFVLVVAPALLVLRALFRRRRRQLAGA